MEKKNCPFCGEEILVVAIKCKHCESILIEDTKLSCPGCGDTISEDTKNCPNCNIDIENILKNCKNCDTLYFLGAIKCSKCEYPLITQELIEAEIEYSKANYGMIKDHLLESYSILASIENLSELLKLYPEKLKWIYNLIEDIVFNRKNNKHSFLYQEVETEKMFGAVKEYNTYTEIFKSFLIEKINLDKNKKIFEYIDLYYSQRNFFYLLFEKNLDKDNLKKGMSNRLNKKIKPEVLKLLTKKPNFKKNKRNIRLLKSELINKIEIIDNNLSKDLENEIIILKTDSPVKKAGFQLLGFYFIVIPLMALVFSMLSINTRNIPNIIKMVSLFGPAITILSIAFYSSFILNKDDNSILSKIEKKLNELQIIIKKDFKNKVS